MKKKCFGAAVLLSCETCSSVLLWIGIRESDWRLSDYSLGTWLNYIGLETNSDL